MEFADIDDNQSKNNFGKYGCVDFERTYGKKPNYVEPRDAVKGHIARSILYMHDVYGLSLLTMGSMLLRWHEQYPVTEEELWRNEAIFKLQSTKNHWVEVNLD